MRQAPPHPGEILQKEFIEPQAYGFQAKAARAMGMSTIRLNQILGGNRSVTPESAILIAELTHTSPELWLRMQMEHDLWHALQAYKKVSASTKGAIKELGAVFESDGNAR